MAKIDLNEFFTPRDYQVPIFDAFKRGYKRILAVLPRRCLAGDTQILMANGSYKLLRDIQIGDRILSWDGDAFVKDTVSDKWSTGIKDTVSIKSPGYLPIVVSPDHVFAHMSPSHDVASWDRIQDIGRRRALLQYGGCLAGSVHNTELASFWGYMLSDGYVAHQQQPKFTNGNKVILDRVAYLAESLFEVKVIWRPKGNGFDLGFSNGTLGGNSSNPIKQLFRQEVVDVPKYQRRLPSSLWNYDEESLLHFFSGLISGDGNIYIHTRKFTPVEGRTVTTSVEITLSCGSNEEYARDIYWLLRKIGIVPHVPYKEKGKSNWRIKISKGLAVKKLLSVRIYGKEEAARSALAIIDSFVRDTRKIKGCFRSIRVTSPGIPQELFDIKTERYHNFVANGYVVHNSGKDIACLNLVIEQALRKTAIYWYILPTYSQGRKVIWDGKLIDGRSFLDMIPKDTIVSKNSSEMKITLNNGSIIQVIGSDNVDRLVGSNPYGIVFSEYAMADDRVFPLLLPILRANDGWAIFISCVAPNTLVIGSNGLQRIKAVSSSRERYSDLNTPIYGLGGFHTAEQFYYGGVCKTLKITLKSGYQLECTPIHPLWNGSEWIKAQDLKVGDLIPVSYGADVWGPGLDTTDFVPNTHAARIERFDYSALDDDFFYLLGLIHADGNYDRNNVCITNAKDPYIQEFLKRYNFRTRKDGIHHELSSRTLSDFLEYLGFKHGAHNKIFPDKLFECTKAQMRSFIQGVFDGDGTSGGGPSKRGSLKVVSVCKSFLKDLQVVLLNFGITSSINTEYKLPTKKVAVASTIHNLTIGGHFAHVFYRDIGFRLERKQKAWQNVPESVRAESGNVYPVDESRLLGYKLTKSAISNPSRISRRTIKSLHAEDPNEYLASLLAEKFFYSPIHSIEESESEVFDFVIPETHSFFSNGIISHNTPRGKNGFYSLWRIAQDNPKHWFSYRMTVEETKHINVAEIQRDIDNGVISADLAKQEYWVSFDMGISGVVYGNSLDRMRLNNQITRVPWNSAYMVNTAWDIGRDTTAICFFQTIGPSVHIIDYYEKASENLEHFAGYIKDKPYVYNKHFFPHDMRVTEWAGPKFTRVEKARQLGIKATIVDEVSLEDGIEYTRSALSRIFIDETNCKQLIKCLENYRYEYDERRQVYRQKPLHDFASHGCFVGETLIKTTAGDMPIQDVMPGMKVITPLGIRTVLDKYEYDVSQTVTIKTNTSSFTCTANHQIFTQDGLFDASSLRYTHLLEPYNRISNWLWKKLFTYCGVGSGLKGFKKSILSLKTSSKSSLMGTFIAFMGNTTGRQKQRSIMPHLSIGLFGSSIMVRYLRDIISTIKTTIRKITQLTTWSLLKPVLIPSCIPIDLIHGQNQKPASKNFCQSTIKLLSGIEAKREGNGIENMPTTRSQRLRERLIHWCVSIAPSSLKEKLGVRNFVLTRAKHLIELSIRKILCGVIALYARLNSFVINTLLKRHAVSHVQLNQCLKTVKVYDLKIESDNCYYANGYLVSNSDSLRYLCLSLPKTSDSMSAKDVDRIKNEALYGSGNDLPGMFNAHWDRIK